MVELPETVGGAIRMIAYGVIEYIDVMQLPATIGPEHDAAVAKALEVEGLLVSDMRALDWKLMRIASGRDMHKFILLGRMQGSPALPTRPTIGKGTIQEVCLSAVDWLDKGPQPVGPSHHGESRRYLKR